jgi:hypothetical protein
MTLNEITALIDSGEYESKYLEFKAAKALPEKTINEFRNELSKDVSSFANSAGGTIIYGVAESPLRLDPIDRKQFSAERLEQLINGNISPGIPDIRIHPIPVEAEKILYAVEIPQGKTAHQAADLKYYRRSERTIYAMQDHEIRDVMRRSSGIETDLDFLPDFGRSHSESKNMQKYRSGRHFEVRVTNLGNRVSNWCVAEISAAAHSIRSNTSSHIVLQTGKEPLEVFTFSNVEKLTEEDKIVAAAYPVPLLPHRKLPLGWITLHDGEYYESKLSHGLMTRFQAPPDTIRWTVYCDEGKPSSGQYSLQALAQQYDELSKSRQ